MIDVNDLIELNLPHRILLLIWKNDSFIGYSHLQAIIFYDEHRNIYIKHICIYIEQKWRERERKRERVDTIYIINYQSRTTTSKFLIIMYLNKCSFAILYLQLFNIRVNITSNIVFISFIQDSTIKGLIFVSWSS